MYTTRFKEFLAIAFMLFAAVAVAFLCFSGHYIYAAILLPALLYFAYYFYRQQRSLLKQVLEFAEAVKYRDFTRRFVVKDTNTEEGLLLAAFNTINETFKNISIDKEIQQQYLSKVINMLDTAIIFYNFNTGKVIWVNDAFKLLFQVPHLGNISGLEKRHADLFDKTIHLKVGQQQVEAAHSSKGKIKLLMQSAAFDTVDGSFRIVAYQNINEAIDETETRAWQKLLRVLTH
ncbi:hypothetical protein ACL9RF_14925 [Sphingobacterium sp. Mn56C]|uniref:hypothetical protein n=1 Tax=Sphingobacterium sp. Mn56C TaxID=3395261 RepID=UPI003BD4D905